MQINWIDFKVELSKRYEAQFSFTHTRITFQNWLLFLFTFICLWNWEQVKVIAWFPSCVDMEINLAFFNNFCLFIRKTHAKIQIQSQFLQFLILQCSIKSTFIVKLFVWGRKQSCGWFTSINLVNINENFVKLSDASSKEEFLREITSALQFFRETTFNIVLKPISIFWFWNFPWKRVYWFFQNNV